LFTGSTCGLTTLATSALATPKVPMGSIAGLDWTTAASPSMSTLSPDSAKARSSSTASAHARFRYLASCSVASNHRLRDMGSPSNVQKIGANPWTLGVLPRCPLLVAARRIRAGVLLAAIGRRGSDSPVRPARAPEVDVAEPLSLELAARETPREVPIGSHSRRTCRGSR